MSPVLRALSQADLAPARALLSASCAFDRADAVAEELLFGRSAAHGPRPIGAWQGDRLVGVAVSSGPWIRVLAVDPASRGRGVGSALLQDAERAIARTATTVRVMDEPGNYLAPGVDERNHETIDWLGRRGYTRLGTSTNLIIDVATNPRVSRARAETLAQACHGYTVRRATGQDRAALTAMVEDEFSASWAFEVDRALAHRPPGVHIARAAADGAIAAFAAHDGNNQGLGWFGPAGTTQTHRGHGLGRALLVACLVDVADAGHAACEVAWIGPRAFYERVAGIQAERRFIRLRKELS